MFSSSQIRAVPPVSKLSMEWLTVSTFWKRTIWPGARTTLCGDTPNAPTSTTTVF